MKKLKISTVKVKKTSVFIKIEEICGQRIGYVILPFNDSTFFKTVNFVTQRAITRFLLVATYHVFGAGSFPVHAVFSRFYSIETYYKKTTSNHKKTTYKTPT